MEPSSEHDEEVSASWQYRIFSGAIRMSANLS